MRSSLQFFSSRRLSAYSQGFFILIVTVLMFSAHANAQTEKSRWLAGGNGSFSRVKTGGDESIESTTSSFSLSPTIGVFFVENLAGGLKFSYSSSRYTNGLSYTYRALEIGPFVRYYFIKPGEKYNFLVEASYQYGTGKGNNSERMNTSTIGAQAGPVLFLNSNVGLELLVGYDRNKYNDVDVKTTTINIGVGLQVHLR